EGALFETIVLDGVLSANGMASFASALDSEEAQSIRAYLIEQANIAKARLAAITPVAAAAPAEPEPHADAPAAEAELHDD
ncbi:MAG TPA: hypothetical protein VGC36_14030, partial [Rhizomicrobium sp.]